MFFPVVMLDLDHTEGWAPQKWRFQTVMLEKTLDIPSDCREIKLFNPKGNQPRIFIGRTNVEAEAPILWPSYSKSTGKDPDAGKEWRREEKVTAEDKMVGWHHQLKGHEFEQALGDDEGKVNLTCYRPWVPRVGCYWTKLTYFCCTDSRY